MADPTPAPTSENTPPAAPTPGPVEPTSAERDEMEALRAALQAEYEAERQLNQKFLADLHARCEADPLVARLRDDCIKAIAQLCRVMGRGWSPHVSGQIVEALVIPRWMTDPKWKTYIDGTGVGDGQALKDLQQRMNPGALPGLGNRVPPFAGLKK